MRRTCCAQAPDRTLTIDNDPNCIAKLKDYRSLMPLAQEARKPMFFLKPADGALGAHSKAFPKPTGTSRELPSGLLPTPGSRGCHDGLIPPTDRIRVSAEADVTGLGPREERSPWAHLDAAHLAGAAAAGGVPGGADRHAAAGPWRAEKRRELCEKIGGRVVKKIERKKMPNGQTVEHVKEETEGGILHWGRETENAETLEWFREEIRKAYGGRAPKVLDPFAGGGAIPLEAMRLGARRRPWTSTPSPGSSSSARWSTRRSWPARPGRCRNSFSTTRSSWPSFSRRPRATARPRRRPP